MKYSVGHPAYPANGCNRYSVHNSLAQAANELVSRGVPKSKAVAACNSAAGGKHVVVIAGRMDVIEINRGL